MFDSVRNNKKIVQIFLGLIALSFGFFGIDSYIKNAGVGDAIASVGKEKITAQQFDQAVRERQEQMRRAYGESFKPEMLNSPDVRRGILNSLIDQRLLWVEAASKKISVPDSVLMSVISSIPALQENGKFSSARYEAALQAQGMSKPQFEAKLRQDLMLQQLVSAVGDAAFVSTTQLNEMLKLQTEERDYATYRIAAAQFANSAKVDEAAIKKFYGDNPAKFEIPEQVKVEYLVLSQQELIKNVAVSEAEIKAWYDAHVDKFAQPEERRASHILILGDKDKAKAKEKAERVLKDVQANPAKFAEIAKELSQDPGSAQKGGDLGFFGKGMMVKPFEDTVFKMKEGELSGVVESEFGFHIIKLTGIKATKARPLSDVRADIETELKRQAASRKFAEAAESFSNMVYEQSDSLQPTADHFKLALHKSDWISKNSLAKDKANLGPLANERLQEAIFSADAIKDKRNSEAVEVAPSTLVSARVVDHVAASAKSLESVKGEIESILRTQEATRLAEKTGEEKLVELKSGKDSLTWASSDTVSRLKRGILSPVALQGIFKVNAQKLPAYSGVAENGDYVIYKVTKVHVPEKVDEGLKGQLKNEYVSLIGKEDMAAYFESLRARYKVEINAAKLEVNKDR